MAFSLFAEMPSASSPRLGPVLADTGVTLLPRDKTSSSSFFIQKEALRLTGEIRVRRRAEVRERGAGAEEAAPSSRRPSSIAGKQVASHLGLCRTEQSFP